MKKIILLFAVLLAFASNAFAQLSSDPNNSFYADAQTWERNGLVDALPPIRPYPVKIIKKILTSVIDKGNESQSAKAKDYWEELTGRPFHAELEAHGTYKNSDGDSSFSFSYFPEVNGDAGLLDDIIGIGYKVGFGGYTQKALDYIRSYVPYGNSLAHDTLQDPGELGPFQMYLDTNDVLSVGNDNFFLQIGLNRMGYGRFLGEGLALNENAYHSGNIVFTVFYDRWNYTQLYSAIGSSKSYDGSKLQSDKFLAFHQFEFNITPKFSISYYENMIFGQRFDFSYLIPAPYMALQGIGGCNDNLQMGLMFNVKPIKGLLWSTDLFVDDVSFNELVKFNLDTKIRAALSTGVIYSPENSMFNNFALQYSLVTPYTYTHWDYTDPVNYTIDDKTFNYQNYTNNGLPIGSTLPPNSDSVKFSFDMTPIKNLNLGFNFMFMRHGNSSETLPADEAVRYLVADPEVYATDGSIYQHTVNVCDGTEGWGYLSSAWHKLNFLNQQHKMYLFQIGLDADYCTPKFKWGQFTVRGGYTAEFIINKGVDSHMFPGVRAEKVGDNTYKYNGHSYTAEELVNMFKNDWISNLTNQFNNYLYLAVQYRW